MFQCSNREPRQRHGFVARIASACLATVLIWLSSSAHPLARKAPGKPAKAQSKIDSRLEQVLREGGSARVIVRAKQAKQSAIKQRLTARGRSTKKDLESIDAFTAEVGAADVGALAADPDVISVSTDAKVTSFEDLAGTPGSEADTLTEVLGTDHLDLTGDRIGIAVLDSGLHRANDLDGARTDKFWDFLEDGKSHAFDDYGHGTHVGGVITGSGKHSPIKRWGRNKKELRELALYRGIAPKARVLSFKVLDEFGVGYTSQVIEALEFVSANQEKLKIDIVNLSLGHPILEPADTDPLVLAVEAAVRSGLIVVVSAGNNGRNPETGEVGYAGITSPGNAPSAITVGAYDPHGTVSRADDTIPDYSSRGPSWYDGFAKPDIVAPGHAVVSAAAPDGTLFRSYPQRRVFDKDGKPNYFRLSGTSMATAVTSGAIALMLERHRDAFGDDVRLSPNVVKALLQFTALPIDGYDGLTQGTGALNPTGIVEVAGLIDSSAPARSWWLTDAPSRTTVLGGVSYSWAQTIVWGNTVVWGNTIAVNQPAWAVAIMWGTTSLWSTTVVWGNNVVWESPQVWCRTIVWGNHAIGTSDGSAIMWGTTDLLAPDTVVWGDLRR